MTKAVQGQSDNASSTSVSDDEQLKIKKQPSKKRKISIKKKPKDDHHEFMNPCYGGNFTDDELEMTVVVPVPGIVTEEADANVERDSSDQSEEEKAGAKKEE